MKIKKEIFDLSEIIFYQKNNHYDDKNVSSYFDIIDNDVWIHIFMFCNDSSLYNILYSNKTTFDFIINNNILWITRMNLIRSKLQKNLVEEFNGNIMKNDNTLIQIKNFEDIVKNIPFQIAYSKSIITITKMEQLIDVFIERIPNKYWKSLIKDIFNRKEIQNPHWIYARLRNGLLYEKCTRCESKCMKRKYSSLYNGHIIEYPRCICTIDQLFYYCYSCSKFCKYIYPNLNHNSKIFPTISYFLLDTYGPFGVPYFQYRSYKMKEKQKIKESYQLSLEYWFPRKKQYLNE